MRFDVTFWQAYSQETAILESVNDYLKMCEFSLNPFFRRTWEIIRVMELCTPKDYYISSCPPTFRIVVRVQIQSLAYSLHILLFSVSTEFSIVIHDERRSSCLFALRKVSFDIPKRAILGCKTACFAMLSANSWFSVIYRMYFKDFAGC